MRFCRDIEFDEDKRICDEDLTELVSVYCNDTVEIQDPNYFLEKIGATQTEDAMRFDKSIMEEKGELMDIEEKLLVQSSEDEYAEVYEPKTYKEAVTGAHSEEWKLAIKEELNSLTENQTWEVVETPRNRKSVGSKWVFRIKKDSHGNIVRYKARLVAKGYTQVEGIDYVRT